MYLAEEDVSGFDSGIVIFICMGVGAAMIVVALIGLVGALSKSTGVLYFVSILTSGEAFRNNRSCYVNFS